MIAFRGARWPLLRRARAAVAAVEFAMTMPALILMFVGMVDVGRAINLRLQMESDVADAINLGMVNASQASSTNGATMASTIASAMGGTLSTTLSAGTVIVNNGPTVTLTNGTTSPSGTAANADSCYCPSGTTAPWSWGGSVTCGSACGSGGYAGKFVSVSETQTFVPLFSSYNLLPGNQISVSAIVQVQ